MQRHDECLARWSPPFTGMRPLIGQRRAEKSTHVVGEPAHASRGWLSQAILAVVALLLAGYLLFAHGCHADEDTELLVKMQNPAHGGGQGFCKVAELVRARVF